MENHEVVESYWLRMECGAKDSKVDRTLKGFNKHSTPSELLSFFFRCHRLRRRQ